MTQLVQDEMDCYNVYKKNQVDFYSVRDQVFLTSTKRMDHIY